MKVGFYTTCNRLVQLFVNIVTLFLTSRNSNIEGCGGDLWRLVLYCLVISVNIVAFILYHIMSVTNDSTTEVLLIHQQIYQVALTAGPISKVFFVIFMSLFFIYLDAIMVYTLCSKPVFKETSRYILFIHMLLNDLIHLLVTTVLYVLGLAFLKVFKPACVLLVFASVTTFLNTPLNLTAMSLERYVAICFPLRHAEIATQKRTYIAFGVIWFIGSINVIIDLLYGTVMDSKYFTPQIFCTRESLFIKQWQVDVFHGFNIFYFVSATLIIFFTYVSILVTARSISSNKDSAMKAHRTVLLHLIQLGLCLTSFLYTIIEKVASYSTTSSSVFVDLQYINLVFVLILPRCLSPLIYGLRDDAIRPLFIYYFRCATGKHKPTVNVH